MIITIRMGPGIGHLELFPHPQICQLKRIILFSDNLVVCTVLLDHGADPNAKDNDQLTALHMAARGGLTQNCQFLLEHTKGHSGNKVDAQGQSALHHAVSCDGVECVAYLLSSGLSANQSDNEMRTYVRKYVHNLIWYIQQSTCTLIPMHMHLHVCVTITECCQTSFVGLLSMKIA